MCVRVMDSLILYAGLFHLPTFACYSPPNSRRAHVCPLRQQVVFKSLSVIRTGSFWRMWSRILSAFCIPPGLGFVCAQAGAAQMADRSICKTDKVPVIT